MATRDSLLQLFLCLWTFIVVDAPPPLAPPHPRHPTQSIHFLLLPLPSIHFLLLSLPSIHFLLHLSLWFNLWSFRIIVNTCLLIKTMTNCIIGVRIFMTLRVCTRVRTGMGWSVYGLIRYEMEKSATTVFWTVFELCYTWICLQSIMYKTGHEIPSPAWGKRGRVT